MLNVSTPSRRKNARPGANIGAVAKLAGVSKAAVSRVLNHGYASPRMREKVQQAMAELDYRPSAAAMNFAAGRTGVVAVVTNNLEGEWVPPVLLGIEQTINQSRRASLLLGSLTHHGIHDPSIVRAWLDERRVDGAIFLRPRRSEARLVETAREQGIPFALIAPDISAKGGVELRSDNILGGQLIGQHLLELGHRRFAFIGGEQTSRDSQERLKGLLIRLDAAGVRLHHRDIVAGSFSGIDGQAFAKRWLRRKKSTRPSAIVFADDSMALGFTGALLEAGVKIPAEVSVTGFNNIPATQWIWPGLTTVEQPLIELGISACEAVLTALELRPPAPAQERVQFPVKLVVRGTTACAPAFD